MTRLSLTQRGERRVLHAQDHAPDIRVCAAVSALTDALDIFLHNAPGVYLEAEALGSGEMYLSFWGGGERVQGAWEMAGLGLLAVARAAPEAVEVQVDLPGLQTAQRGDGRTVEA